MLLQVRTSRTKTAMNRLGTVSYSLPESQRFVFKSTSSIAMIQWRQGEGELTAIQRSRINRQDPVAARNGHISSVLQQGAHDL